MIYLIIAIVVFLVWSEWLVHGSDDGKAFKQRNRDEYDVSQELHVSGPSDLYYISAEEKRAYMQSEKWGILKYLRMLIAQDKCECCGATEHLQLHHETYIRLTEEEIDDLKILCADCHQKLHDKLGYDRLTYYPITALKEQ